MNKLPDEQFLFGASCAPYAKSMDWPEDEWDNDFATMRKLNFNVIRIFAAWDRIEREEGVLYILINHSQDQRQFRVALRDQAEEWLEMGSNQTVDMNSEITLDAQGVLALKKA